MKGYRVEFSQDQKTVCIVPRPFIPADHFFVLSAVLVKEGYKWMIPSDERCGYLFTNVDPGDDS